MQEDANAAQRSAINANQRFPVIDCADALSLSLSLSVAHQGPCVPMHGRSMFWSLMKEDERDRFLRRIFFFRMSSLCPCFLRIVSLSRLSARSAQTALTCFLPDPSRRHEYVTLATASSTATAIMCSSVFCTLKNTLAVQQRKIKLIVFAGGSKQKAKYNVFCNCREVNWTNVHVKNKKKNDRKWQNHLLLVLEGLCSSQEQGWNSGIADS